MGLASPIFSFLALFSASPSLLSGNIAAVALGVHVFAECLIGDRR